MLKLYRIFIIASVFIVICSSVNAEKVTHITKTTLQNGMQLIVREGHSINLAAVDIWIKAGVVNETPETNGISHFIEHMIFKTTSKYASGQIDREIEGLGAELNGGTSKDWVHFYTTVNSAYLPSVIEILSDAIMGAQFKPEDVEKERQIILDEIARAESNPIKQTMNLFAKHFYGSHPYSLVPAGTREAISSLTRDELYAYYKKMYTPSNICVVITGDVTLEKATEMVKKSFEGFSNGSDNTTSELPEPLKIPDEPSAVKYHLPYDKAHVVLGFAAASASELKESCILDTLLIILGDTKSGRIASALNDAKINYTYISTDFIDQKYTSAFSVHVVVDPKDTEIASSIILTQLLLLSYEPVSSNELLHAKRIVEGQHLFMQETFAGQARLLGMYNAIGSWDYSLKYGPTVQKLNAADITKTAIKYFSKNNYTLLVISPEKAAK